MNWCIKFIRNFFVVTLVISLIIAIVILGLDVDLLKNGPYYLSLLVWKIVHKNGETSVTHEEILDNLEEAQRSLWVHIPMLVLVFLCSLVIFMCIVGLIGAYFLSYSIMAGYAMFQFITCMFLSVIVLWVFLNNMKDTETNSYMHEKILQYQTNSSFNVIIDFVQKDLQCCGFRSPKDWDVYPLSCCPNYEVAILEDCTENCATHACTEELAYKQSCLTSARMHLLDPSSFMGFLGIGLIIASIVLFLNLVLSFLLCLIARSRRTKEWSMPVDDFQYEDEEQSKLMISHM